MAAREGPSVVVLITCKRCGLTKQKVEVRKRRHDEELMVWMDAAVTPAAYHAHTLKSLLCESREYDLMLPLPRQGSNEGFGMSEELNPSKEYIKEMSEACAAEAPKKRGRRRKR
jgi:hypothetical protein